MLSEHIRLNARELLSAPRSLALRRAYHSGLPVTRVCVVNVCTIIEAPLLVELLAQTDWFERGQKFACMNLESQFE